MADISFQWTQVTTLQFIELLRQHPCLWQVKNSNYKNKTARNLSIIAIARSENLTGITPEDVMKKLHTLRSQLRKEMKDIKASQKSGAGKDEVYIAKL